MELRSGIQLARQQYLALLHKNAILTWRNKRSAFLQLFSSLFFIILMFCIDRASQFSSTNSKVLEMPPQVSFPIPPCEDKFFIETPCFDFLWSGNTSTRISSLVQSIMKNNPGRPIPANKIMSFETPEDVDVWLLNNPRRSSGALHFTVQDSTVISYGIQTNSTAVARRADYEDPTFKFQIPLQIAAEREIARSLIGDPNFAWDIALKKFPQPVIKNTSAVGKAGPTFFLAIAMFGFVFQISSLVTEKELKLRQAMSMMGLYEPAYWLSWLTWEAMLTFLSALLTVLFGLMFRFDFFKYNSLAVLFLVFFLFQINMLSFAFMISTLISKSTSATTVGFSIFIIGFLTQLVATTGFPYSSSHKKLYRIIWSFFPPNIFAKAISSLDAATLITEEPGVSWSKISRCTSNEPDCVITIETIYKWLILTFFLWFVLAVYFDNIIPNANGVRKPVLYFLNPGYWTGRSGSKVKEGSIFSFIGSPPQVKDTSPTDKDVLDEEMMVKQQAEKGMTDEGVAVQLCGLIKTYPSTYTLGCSCVCCCCCLKVKRTAPYHAVKGLWLNLAKGQLFCLLGPNGAGKTTTISCLTGITPITGGDALVYGHSVASSVGMAKIRRLIGVCPQFDILWDALTGQEHLELFANIKGLPPSEIKSVAAKSLSEGKLKTATNVRVGNYSGGMKRHLSVAIALIGDPRLVFLDEPTTGMDPITRRHVWDIIEDAKRGRAIVLTTHSMEEADILGDRIAIMAKGKLRCIGTSIHLKSRFGAGYVCNINFSTTNGEPQMEPIKFFFYNHLDVKPTEESKTFLTFVIPHNKEPLLARFFAELQEREYEFGISDIQIGLTTLEEVFLNIAKQAELESSSAAQENLVVLHLTSGTSIQVSMGVRFVGIPNTESVEHPRGLMVEVFWKTDDAGTLCISHHSPEAPIPPNVELIKNESLIGDMPVGFTIDPNQILNAYER
ncbi:hypothetical protein LUZ63_015788 [Rhynchospora breviuscula]|uniref:ABC transporter domain-containing protein n=1 Tax=Rhynchospora breviuscula TaxID=2022672 RepID=A0A9Q0HMZ3_9POAL|nr:hypothetical protein LUZ63_015788 [Rhynchospora breviuscula]